MGAGAGSGPGLPTFSPRLNPTQVRVPAATKAKHVRCVVKEQHLALEVSTLPAGKALVADGELFQKVDIEGCNWTLGDEKDKGRVLTLTLQKQQQMTWLMLIRS